MQPRQRQQWLVRGLLPSFGVVVASRYVYVGGMGFSQNFGKKNTNIFPTELINAELDMIYYQFVEFISPLLEDMAKVEKKEGGKKQMLPEYQY